MKLYLSPTLMRRCSGWGWGCSKLPAAGHMVPTHHTHGVPLPGWHLWGCVCPGKSVILFLFQCMLSHFSHVQLFATLWTTAHQAPLSVGFLRQEYWSGLPFPSPRDLLDQRSNPRLLGLLHYRQILLCWAIGEAPPSYRPKSNSKGRVEKEVRAFRFSSIYWVHWAPRVVQRYRTLPANGGDMGPIPGWEDPLK